MTYLIESPLDDLDTASLYGMLGDAWCLQFEPKKGESYCLESSVKIGKREFDAIVPFLRAGLVPTNRTEVIAAVKQTIKENDFWHMPVYVVAALVAREGMLTPKT